MRRTWMSRLRIAALICSCSSLQPLAADDADLFGVNADASASFPRIAANYTPAKFLQQELDVRDESAYAVEPPEVDQDAARADELDVRDESAYAVEPADVGEDSLATLSERLEALEGDWTEFQEGLAEEEEPSLLEGSTWEMGGRIHLDYWDFLEDSPGIGFFENPTGADAGNDPQNQFGFRRIRLEFQGEVPANMIFRIQIDFNEPAQPEMKDVYLGWSELPYNQELLIGNQKRPLGLDHLNSSRFNVFIERPLVVEAFNEDARRLGIAMYGYSDGPDVVNWRYGLYSLENIAESGRLRGDNLQMGGYGRLASTPWWDETSGGRGYLHLALAGAVTSPDGDGSQDLDDNNNEARFRTRPSARSQSRWIDTGQILGARWYEIAALEAVLNIGAFQLTGEYMSLWLQTDDVPRPDFNFHGGYLYASYFLTGEHMVFDRTSGTLERVIPFENFFLVDRCSGGRGYGLGAWQVAFRYSYLDLTDGPPETAYDFDDNVSLAGGVEGGEEQNYTAALNWYWTPYSKLQSNLIYSDIEDHRSVGGFTQGDAWILGTRFQIDF